jgi:hypothetical protein
MEMAAGSVVSHQSFEDIWGPRIGAEGAVVLRRTSYLGFVLGLGVLASAIGASFAFVSGHGAGAVLGGVCVLVGVALFALWIWTRTTLANAVANHIGGASQLVGDAKDAAGPVRRMDW